MPIVALSMIAVVFGQERSKNADPGPLLEKLTKELRESKTSSRRRKAAEAIGQIGREAESATAALCSGLCERNASVRQACSEALEKVAPEFREVVLPIVLDGSRDKRIERLGKIAAAGSEYEDALPAVLFRFRISYDSINPGNAGAEIMEASECLRAMFAIAPQENSVAETMLSVASKGSISSMRGQAIGYLPLMEIRDSKRVAAVLMNAVKIDNDENRIIAIKSLARLGSDALQSADLLRKAKGSSNAAVREAAESTLSVFAKIKQAEIGEKEKASRKRKEKLAEP